MLVSSFNHTALKGTNLQNPENTELEDSLSGSKPVRYPDIHSLNISQC